MLICLPLPPAGSIETCEDAQDALEVLTRINLRIMRRVHVPSLYSSGVRYENERPVFDRQGRRLAIERFDHVLIVIARGDGDCDDLAGWRCAELRLAGEHAMPRIIWPEGERRYHAQVRRANGDIEDPSLILSIRQQRNLRHG